MKMFTYLYFSIFVAACVGTALAFTLDISFLKALCPMLAVAFGFYTAFLHFSEDAKGLVSEPPAKNSQRHDMPATRQWVEEVINAKTSNCVTPAGRTVKHLQTQIEDLRSSGHHAWFHVCKNGEMVGYIMWGHFEGHLEGSQRGSGYCDVDGVFSFVKGANGRIGEHVTQVLTPSAEALEEFKELARQAEYDYESSGGSLFWSPSSKYLKFGRADAYRLLANLPAPGSID